MGAKITNEAPVGVKAGLRASYQWVTQEMLDAVNRCALGATLGLPCWGLPCRALQGLSRGGFRWLTNFRLPCLSVHCWLRPFPPDKLASPDTGLRLPPVFPQV